MSASGGPRRRPAPVDVAITGIAVLLVTLAVTQMGGLGRQGGSPSASLPSGLGAPSAVVPSGGSGRPSPSPGACSTTVDAGADLEEQFANLVPGTVLCLSDGAYEPPRFTSDEETDGTPEAPVVVRSAPGADVTILGVTELIDADHWILFDLEIEGQGFGGDLVRIIGGDGVTLDSLRIHGSTGGAGLLLGRSARYGPVNDYVVRNSVVYDAPSETNLYLNPGADSSGGLIERNLFLNAGNQNTKIGWGSPDCDAMRDEQFGAGGRIVYRYNTIYNDRAVESSGHQPLAFAEPVTGVIRAHHNIIVKSQSSDRPLLLRLDVEPCESFTGTATVRDSIGWGLTDVEDFCWNGGADDGPSCDDVVDWETVRLIDPRFDSLDPVDGFRPTNPEAQGFGRYAE